MKKIKIYFDSDLNLNVLHNRLVELYVNRTPISWGNDSIKIVLLIEPPEIMNINNQIISGLNSGIINELLTHDDDLLKHPNTHLFEFGYCWIKEYVPQNKKFEISGLLGGKRRTEGHLFRYELFNKIDLSVCSIAKISTLSAFNFFVISELSE